MGASSYFPSRRGRLAVAAFAALVTIAPPTRAEPARTVWSCWLDDGQHLACLALHATRVEGPQTERARPAQRPAEMLRAIRERPNSLRGQTIRIPLHNVPYDDAFVAQLAQAVLCGAQRDCETRYQPELARLVAQSPSDFDDAHDPLLTGESE